LKGRKRGSQMFVVVPAIEMRAIRWVGDFGPNDKQCFRGHDVLLSLDPVLGHQFWHRTDFLANRALGPLRAGKLTCHERRPEFRL
jgi:hypothetical protein